MVGKDSFERRRSGGGLLVVLLLVVLVAGGYGLWGALRQAPAPQVTLETERNAVGRAVKVKATFAEPKRGLGTVRFELAQGERSVVLGEKTFERAGAYSFRRGNATETYTIETTVGRDVQDWLKEGDLTLRASADRMAGVFRSDEPTVVEKKLAVKLRPPRLELLSQQHYVRQGGAGTVIQRCGEGARCGVRAGTLDFLSYPLPGATAGERFTLFALPWELGDPQQVKIFAEDDAGNRAELPFITIFKPKAPSHDTIRIDDVFLEKVVPAITSQTPGFDTSGSLLDQYLRINGEMRRRILAQVADLSKQTEAKFLWQEPFLQMANSARRAGFAETRSYEYNGRKVDEQTHLGLDLASLSGAPVPAPNAGRVVFAGWLGIYGNAVIIDHGFGLMSLSGHLSAISAKEGDRVTRGQIVGNTGATGLAGGDHLHLEIFVQGKSVDPVEWLDPHWIDDNVRTRLPVPGA